MTDPGDSSQGNQDLVAHPSKKAPSENPFAQSANITLSVPESVEVKLVDASVLADYEMWVLLTSILSSAVTGFLVAIVQAVPDDRGRYIVITIVFGLLMLVCGFMAFSKRNKLGSKTRRIRLRVVGDPVKDE